MISSFRRSIASLICAVMAFEPLAASYAASQQYRIPLKLGGASAQLLITPDPVDFGDVARTQLKTLPITVRNTGSAGVSGLTAAVAAPFSVDTRGCLSLAAGASCAMAVSFLPAVAGPASATLVLGSALGVSGTAQLIGNAVALIDDVELTDGGWFFGHWKLGETSPVKQLGIKNNGTGPVTITQLYLVNGHSDFAMRHTCGAQLPPGQSCVVTADFSPSVLGERIGAFRIKRADGALRDVWMLGYGADLTDPDAPPLGGGGLSVADRLDFGEVAAGTASGAMRALTVANAGAVPLSLGSMLLDTAGSAGFTIDESACPAQLSAYETCAILVDFNPAAVGPFATTLTVNAANPAALRVTHITGEGVAALGNATLSASDLAIDFGETEWQVPVDRTLTLTNAGPDTALVQYTYATNARNFVVTDGCDKPLATGDSCTLTVQFTGLTPEHSTGDLVISSKTGQSLVIPLTGHVPSGVIELSSVAIAIPGTAVGETSAVHSVRVTNIGSKPLHVGAVGMSSGSEFQAANACGDPLAPGESCQVDVVFTPYLGGTREDSIVIQSNDHLRPFVNAMVRGQGIDGYLVATSTWLDFGAVQVGSKVQKTVTLANPGDGGVRFTSISLGGLGAGLTSNNDCGLILLKGNTCSIVVQFAPAAPVDFTSYKRQELRIVTPIPEQWRGFYQLELPVTARGVSLDEALVATPPVLNFGSLEPGQQASLTTILTNIADLPISMGNGAVTGAAAAVYSVAGSSCAGVTLARGQACTVSVQANMAALGTHAATLELDLNTGAGVKRVNLTALGIAHVPDAALSLNPSSVDFGIVMPGNPLSRVVQVTNDGPEPVRVSHAYAQMPDAKLAPAFSLDASACLTGGVINVGTSCELVVGFDGQAEGVPTATLHVVAENRTSVQASLRAQGPTPTLELSTNALALAATSVMGASPAQSVTVTNTGLGALQFQGINVGGEFGVSSSCPASLKQGDSCAMSVTHKPVTPGAHTGALTIRSNDLANPAVQVALASLGQVSQLRAEPVAVTFNQPAVGVTAHQVFSLVNDGPGDAYLSRVELEGVDVNRFSLDRAACGAMLQAGDSCPVTVRFTPTEAGRVTAQIRVTEATDAVLTVPLTGQGPTVRLSVSASALAFGNQLVNTASVPQTIVLRNEGASPARIKSIQVNDPKSPFSVNASACPALLAAGSTCDVHVTFAPKEPQSFAETLVVATANTAGDLHMMLSGRGLGEAGKLSLEHSTGNFGNLAQGATYVQLVSLVNTGSSPLQVTAITVPDSAGGIFARQAGGNCATTLPFTLNAGRSCSVALQATGLALGAYTGRFEVKTEDPTEVVSLELSASVTEPDFILSATPGDISPVSGAFEELAAYSEAGQPNPTADKTLYLVNALRMAGTAIDAPRVEITGVDAAQFRLRSVFKASNTATRAASGAVISPDGLSATGGAVDDGKGAYPHLGVAFEYAPTQRGVHVAQLNIYYNDGSYAHLPLFGSADWYAYGTLAQPLQGDFGTTTFNAGSPSGFVEKTSTILTTSYLGKNLRVTRMRIQGADAASFAIQAYSGRLGGDGTVPSQGIAPSQMVSDKGGAISVVVRFTPTRLGLQEANLIIEHNGEDVAPLVVPLSGTGAHDVQVSVSGGPGIVPISSLPDTGLGKVTTMNVFLRNAGTFGNVTFHDMQIVGSAAFSFSSVGLASGTNIAAQGLADNTRYTLINRTGADVKDGGFTDLGIGVRFNPNTLGVHNASVTVWHDGPGGKTVFDLAGEGMRAKAVLSTGTTLPAAAPSGDFGTVAFRESSSPDNLSAVQTWYFLNETGIDLLGVQRLRIVGEDEAAFAITGYTGAASGFTPTQDVLTFSLKQSTTTSALMGQLRFTPQHAGVHQAVLEVYHDGSNASPFVLPLTGAGAWNVDPTASPASHEFGEIGTGAPAVTRDVFVRANGAQGRIRYSGFELTGSADFTISTVGLVTRNTQIWGTGVNVRAYAAGTRQGSDVFTGVHVATGGLTDLGARVIYTPTIRGSQTATFTVYHDGPEGQTTFVLSAEGVRAVTVALTGANPYSTLVPIPDFARVGLNTAAQTKTVYLKASGAHGQVTYKGFKVEGSEDMRVASVSQVYNIRDYCFPQGMNTTSLISFATESGAGSRAAEFSLTGTNIATACSAYNERPGPHFALNLRYDPRTLGKQTATVKVYHDGNDEGFSAFEISGEAFRDVSVAFTGVNPYSTLVPISNFARVGLNTAAQTKTVYLKASGAHGQVTYKGFKVEGSEDMRVASVSQVYNKRDYCHPGGMNTTSLISYATESGAGSRAAEFSLTGTNIATACSAYNERPGPHFALNLRYDPRTLGKQTATVKVYHDGNDEGFSAFEISGEAY